MGHYGFLREAPTLALSKSETLEAIDTKFCMIYYVVEISGCIKIITIGCKGGAPTYT